MAIKKPLSIGCGLNVGTGIDSTQLRNAIKGIKLAVNENASSMPISQVATDCRAGDSIDCGLN